MTFASNHIAVVFPVYNTVRYLEEACRSLMRQRHSAFTVFAVDDGSKDNSGRLLDTMAADDSRFVVIHQQNGGVSRARNVALERIESLGIPWVAFFDSDDRASETFLSDFWKGLQSSDVDVAVCGWRAFDQNGWFEETLQSMEAGILEGTSSIAKQFFAPMWVNGCRNPQVSTFVSNRCIRMECMRGLRFDENLRGGEDQEFFLRVLPSLKRATLVPRINLFYRMRGSSLSTEPSHRAYELTCYLNKLEDLSSYPLEAQVGIEKFTLDCWWQEVRRVYSKGGSIAEKNFLRKTAERLQRYPWHFPLSGKYESRFRRFRMGDWFLHLYFRLRINRAVRRKAHYFP